jgi:hypothetical protein
VSTGREGSKTWTTEEQAILTSKMEKEGRRSCKVKENKFCGGNVDSPLEMQI